MVILSVPTSQKSSHMTIFIRIYTNFHAWNTCDLHGVGVEALHSSALLNPSALLYYLETSAFCM